MADAVDAVRADRDAVLEIAAGLTVQQWETESGCEGWSLQDLLTHMGLTFWAMVDPERLADTHGLPFERAQDVLVQARRYLEPAEVVADYAEVSERALRMLPEIAALDAELPLGDVGTYPASALPTAFGFDHFTHIRMDMFGPRGPLGGSPPPSDELRVATALDWIEAALPQQNQAAGAAGTFEFQITGAGARLITFGCGQAMATVTSDALDFVRWVTQRGSWADLGVQTAGDDLALAAARTLRVF
jgi:uncharacterized protein (TIGR03083 family)